MAVIAKHIAYAIASGAALIRSIPVLKPCPFLIGAEHGLDTSGTEGLDRSPGPKLNMRWTPGRYTGRYANRLS
jgi:hypothetical protein